jgi:hypothetical protein
MSEIEELVASAKKYNSKRYKRMAELLLQLHIDNQLLQEKLIAALQLRLIGVAVDDVVKEGK